jgi:ribokinase
MKDNPAAFSANAQVLVIGNATIDETFEVATLPQTGESLLGSLRFQDVGGKGANVAAIFARCGLATRFTTVVGNDERGKAIVDTLSAEALKLDVVFSDACRTDVSVIFSDQCGDNTIVSTVQAVQSLEYTKAIQALKVLRHQDILVLQANLAESLIRQLIQHANRAGVVVVFNPSPYAPWVNSIIQDVDIVFVNSRECTQLTGMHGTNAVAALLQLGPKQVVLTCGEAGALLGSAISEISYAESPVFERSASIAATALDTTGAGDTFLAVAVASACIRSSALDQLALEHAAKAAAITIGRYGTLTAFPDALALTEILRKP